MKAVIKNIMLAFFIVLGFFVCYGMTKVNACVVPLECDEEGIPSVVQSEDLVMQNFDLKVTSFNKTSANIILQLAIKNNGGDRTVIVGVPAGMVESRQIKLNSKQPTDLIDSSNTTYHTWELEIKSNEIAYANLTITTIAYGYTNDSSRITLNLGRLKSWAGLGNVVVEMDIRDSALYSYDPTPSLVPTYIEESGRHVWKLNSKPENLTIYYCPDDVVLKKFFLNVYKDGHEREAATFFYSSDYYGAIKLIDEKLSDNVDFQFMKMVCAEKLGMVDVAESILSQIYDKTVCFSGNGSFDISEYVAKRMLYDYYKILLNKNYKQELLSKLLSDGIESMSTSKSRIFINWAKSEIKMLETVVEDDKKTDDTLPDGEEIKKKSLIKELSNPVVIATGVVMVAVVLFCVIGMTSNGKKKKAEKTNYKKL